MMVLLCQEKQYHNMLENIADNTSTLIGTLGEDNVASLRACFLNAQNDQCLTYQDCLCKSHSTCSQNSQVNIAGFNGVPLYS